MKTKDIIYILIILTLSLFIYYKLTITDPIIIEPIKPKIEIIDSVVVKYDTTIIKIKERIETKKHIPIIRAADVDMDSLQRLFTGYHTSSSKANNNH
jgi:hypothetical protein